MQFQYSMVNMKVVLALSGTDGVSVSTDLAQRVAKCILEVEDLASPDLREAEATLTAMVHLNSFMAATRTSLYNRMEAVFRPTFQALCSHILRDMDGGDYAIDIANHNTLNKKCWDELSCEMVGWALAEEMQQFFAVRDSAASAARVLELTLQLQQHLKQSEGKGQGQKCDEDYSGALQCALDELCRTLECVDEASLRGILRPTC